jgi:hypothetical protein
LNNTLYILFKLKEPTTEGAVERGILAVVAPIEGLNLTAQFREGKLEQFELVMVTQRRLLVGRALCLPLMGLVGVNDLVIGALTDFAVVEPVADHRIIGPPYLGFAVGLGMRLGVVFPGKGEWIAPACSGAMVRIGGVKDGRTL